MSEMGYYTRYTLETSLTYTSCDPDVAWNECKESFGTFDEACKWYEWEQDMLKFSALWPGVLFHVHGEGEESGDIWDAYFLNGKRQICKAEVKIPPFDPSKLE
jgi:hypothetical protein